MGWIIEGVWATRDGKTYDAEMSQIDHEGGMRKVFLPGISEPLYRFKWEEIRNREGEIELWRAHAYGMTLNIFND